MIRNTTQRPLMNHQKEAIRILQKLKGRCGLFMAPGTGKTLTLIRFVQPERRRAYFPALIICRRDDYLTWEQELLAEGVPPEEIFFVDHKSEYTTRKRSGKYKRIHQQEFPDKPKRWNIVSYDLIRETGQKLSDAGWWIFNNHFEIVAADECQTIKRWKANRSKTVIAAVRNIKMRVPMTGTPITQSVEDAFMHGLFANEGETFGKTWFLFMKRYYNKCKMTKAWYIKKGSKKRIQTRMGEFSYYVHEDDKGVMKLPTAMPPVLKSCSMYGKQRKMYETVLEHWEIKQSNGEYYELDYVIDVTQKLKQIASGFYYDKNGKAVRVKNRKIELLEDLATDPEYLKNENSIIWVSLKEEVEIVSELAHKLGIGYIAYIGGSRKQREAMRIQYRDDPSIQWFICNVERGKGMNELIKARNRVYFSNSTKVEAKEQSLRRNRRKGSEKLHESIRTFELVTEGTLEIDIINSLTSGIDFAQYILKKAKHGLKLREILSQSLIRSA